MPNILSLQTLLLGIVMFNGLAILFIGYNQSASSLTGRVLATNDAYQAPTTVNSYQFEDPVTAFEVLNQLDIFEQVEVADRDFSATGKFGKSYMSTVPDRDYCRKHRAHVINHPEVIFEQKNIITSLIHNSLLRRRVIPSIGSDIQPQIGSGISKDFKGKALYELRADINNFFTFFGMYTDRALGVQYSCLSQMSNAIPGHSQLFRKDYISESVVRYANSYESRPQCFNFDKFFPKTWILYEQDQCEDFFKHFNSEDYQELKRERGGIVYMRKIGAAVHQGMGVFPINEKEEAYINELYDFGARCGKIKNNNIIQYFVYNPLLLYGHKFDFRIYMLIASSNPVITYYYDGFLRVSLHKYQSDSKELGALLTNTALSKSLFNKAEQEGTYNNMTSAELKDFHLWNFQRLENYLYENGIVTDRNWLDNYLRPEFRKALAHLIRMSQEPFMKMSSVYHLFGMDFMLDANLNLWFIEANASPALEGFSVEMMDFVAKMLTDHFEIVYGLMRSRMKRAIEYVNTLIKSDEIFTDSEGQVEILDLETKREYFRQITTNYFEPEFEPSASNGFQPVINENFMGEQMYFGLLKEECIDSTM